MLIFYIWMNFQITFDFSLHYPILWLENPIKLKKKKKHTHKLLFLPYFLSCFNSIFSVKAFKESRNPTAVGIPMGKLLDTKWAFCQAFRCISVTQKCVAGVWTSSSPWGIHGLDEQACAVMSMLVRHYSEWDRKLEGVGRSDFGSVTPRSPL